MTWRHRTEIVPELGAVKHILAFKMFGRYLVITWVWTA